LSLESGNQALFSQIHFKCFISNLVCLIQDLGQIVFVWRCLLHPPEMFSIVLGFEFIYVIILLHCTEVENGVGEEMIHLWSVIVKTCFFAGINLNTHSLVITAHLSKYYALKHVSSKPFLVVCPPWPRWVSPYFWHDWISWRLFSRS
jgi:hypothetical protein